GAEGHGYDREGGRAAARPLFEPSLQHAAEEELFGESDDPKEGEERSGDLPRGNGPMRREGVQEDAEGGCDRKEQAEVERSDSPFGGGRRKGEASLGDAAFEHERQHRHGNQCYVSQRVELLTKVDRIDGVEVA